MKSKCFWKKRFFAVILAVNVILTAVPQYGNAAETIIRNEGEKSAVSCQAYEETVQECEAERSSQERETEALSQERETEASSEKREAETSSREQETEGSSQERETEGSSREQETEGLSQERETEGSSQECETEGSSQERETEGSSQEQETETLVQDHENETSAQEPDTEDDFFAMEEETATETFAQSILTASKGKVSLTVTLKDGSSFPVGADVQLLQISDIEIQSGDIQFDSDILTKELESAWADVLVTEYLRGHSDSGNAMYEDNIRQNIWNSVSLFLPYYIRIMDASGNEFSGEEMILSFTVDDEDAFYRAAAGNVVNRIGHHDEARAYSLSEDIGELKIELHESNRTVSYCIDAFTGGWYSLMQTDTGWNPEDSGEMKSDSEVSLFAAAALTEQAAAQKSLPDSLGIQDGNPAWVPEGLRAGKASTHKRRVVFQTDDGEVVKWAYCLEPLKGNPGEDEYDISEAVVLKSGTTNLNLAKTLYYLYGGPAWGKTVNGIDLKGIMTAAGCTTSDNYYAVTHYVLGYFYNNGDANLWNAHPEQTGVLNSKGVNLVKTLVNHIVSMPDPYVHLSKTSVSSTFDSEQKLNVTEPVTYHAFKEDKAIISLPSDVILVNETTGQNSSGNVTINGGDTFHLEAPPSVSGKSSYILKCLVATDFTAFKKTFTGDAQDLGFAFYSSTNTLEMSVDWPQISIVKIKKTSALPDITKGNNMYSLVNARFGIYADAKCTSRVAELTTDANGSSADAALAPGTYYVREETAPEGFLLSNEIKTVTVRDGMQAEVSFTDVPIVDNVDKLLRKCVNGNTDISMKDARFTVRFYGKATPSGVPLRTWVIKTDGDGLLRLTDSAKESGDAFYTDAAGNTCLPLGCITFTETAAPAGCQINTDVVTGYITKDGIKWKDNNVLQNPVDFDNEPCFIGVKIRKRDTENSWDAQGDASLGGAVFAIISDNNYTVVKDSDRNTTYKKGDEIMRITTDERGIAQTSAELQAGSYLVKEVKAPEGYRLNSEKVLAFQSMKHGEIVDLTADAVDETVIRGSFAVSKWDLELNEEKRTQGDAVLQGAKFSLVNRSPNNVLVDVDQDGEKEIYAPYEEIMRFQTDMDGKYISRDKLLPFGTYELTEVEPPDGYTSEGENISRLFTIREDGSCTELSDETTATKNRVIRGDISIYKFCGTLSSEESSEDVIPLSGVEFEIRLKSTGELFDTLVTDEEGHATTVNKEEYPDGRLPYGLYVVTETVHPETVQAVKPFEVFVGLDDNGNKIDHFHYKGIYKNDRPIEASITLVKKDGESGKVIPMAGTEFQILNEYKEVITFMNYYPHREEITNFVTDESGTVNLPEKLPYGVYYLREIKAPEGYLRGEELEFRISEFSTWERPLIIEYSDMPAKGIIRIKKMDEDTAKPVTGATFAVFAKSDIITGDRTLHHSAGSLVSTFTVDGSGLGETGELYPGSYYIQEVKAPQGFCIDECRYDIDIIYENQETAVIYRDKDFYNKPTTLELIKTDSDGKAMEGICFEISPTEGTQEEIRFKTDKEGKIVRKYLLPGTYFIKEQETFPGYILDTCVRYVTVDENGCIFESDEAGNPLDEDNAVSDTETLHWENEYITWEFSKVDVNGDLELAGAQMEIRDSEGRSVHNWVSDGTIHSIHKIPEGSYVLLEKAAPEGYTTALEMPFEVTADAVVKKTTMVDKQVFVSKRDITSKEELPGARLVVTDKDGQIMDEWISAEAPHPVSNLKVGESYTLTEIQAPLGYAVAESILFKVEDDCKIQTVLMEDEREKESETEKARDSDETEKVLVSGKAGSISPGTGDSVNIMLYVILALSSLCTAGIVFYWKSRYNGKR